jgi:hypothetical protein
MLYCIRILVQFVLSKCRSKCDVQLMSLVYDFSQGITRMNRKVSLNCLSNLECTMFRGHGLVSLEGMNSSFTRTFQIVLKVKTLFFLCNVHIKPQQMVVGESIWDSYPRKLEQSLARTSPLHKTLHWPHMTCHI